jgi:O-antigen/teichoic acid export membrane protein
VTATKKSILKGGVKLSLGQIVAQACSMVRSIILARLISPANFGIAATFAITFSLFEMLSNLSADRLLVQAKDGDEPKLQSTAQMLNAVRGLVNATIIFFLARPISGMFGVPQARWAFQCLAIVPLTRGFTHLDSNRVQRTLRFGQSVFLDVATNVLGTLVAYPLGYWLRDYSAMLWLLVIQSATLLVASHLVAERPYSLAWDRQYIKKMTSFGWPLLINGLLMFGIFEGDRFIVGASNRLFARSIYTLGDLGVYSVAFSLTMAPTMFVANVCTSLFLPLLSQAQGAAEQFNRRYSACSQVIALLAASISIPFILAGGKCVLLIYGQKYQAAGSIIGWLAAMWAVRMIRVTPTLGAMALGDTVNSMISNILRSAAIAGVLAAAALGSGLKWIAISGLTGEIIATVASLARLKHRNGVPAMLCLRPLTVSAVAMIAAGLASAFSGNAWPLAIGISALFIGLTVLTMLRVSPFLRQDLHGMIFPPPAPIPPRNLAL